MSRVGWSRTHIPVAMAFLVGSVLLLSCQPAQPVPLGTPKAGETPAQKPPAVATATKPAEKPVRGGTLRMALALDPQTFDVGVSSFSPNLYRNLYDALTGVDNDLNVTKDGLAKDWTFSSDGKAITFKLREGVKFHDGTDLDAAAVKFNVERIKDPASKSLTAAVFASVTSVDVVDGLTVRFNLKAPDPLLIPNLGTNGGMVVSPAAVKKYGQDFGRNPVGTGPFQFVEWKSGDSFTLKRFDGYWRKDKDGDRLPYLDQLVYKILGDQATTVANLRTGQVDLIDDFPEDQVALIQNNPNLVTSVRGYTNMGVIHLNTKTRPPFDNKALRQAAALAVDREGTALRHGANPQASVFHPMDWAYDGKSGMFPNQDLAKAKAKMAEAGYAGGVKATILTGPPSGAYRFIAEIAQASLAQVGIDLKIETLTGSAMQDRTRFAPFDYQMAAFGTTLGMNDPGHVLSLMFHSKGSRNYYGPYSNPKVDELLDKAGSIYDQKERTALYRQAGELIVDDVPFIPLQVSNKMVAMSKKIRNYAQYYDNSQVMREVWLGQ